MNQTIKRRRRFESPVCLTAAVLTTFMILQSVSPSAAAQESDPISFEAFIDDRPLSDVDGNDPLDLGDREVTIRIEAENTSDDPVTIRSMSFEGTALGLDFFGYDVRVDMTIEPGESDDREFLLDLGDLSEQAVGLLPAQFDLTSDEGDTLASDSLVVDIDGKVNSVYGTFGILIFAATALLLGGALYRLFTNRLPINRWRRGIYFGVPGLGVGLCLTFGLSVLRLLSPEATIWKGLLIGGGILGFVLGYLTPNPYDEEEERDEFDEFLEYRDEVGASTP